MSFGSAFLQDRWVIDEVFEGRKGGYFIEAGALDGVNESNTVRLEREYGWSGLCVEPSDAYFRDLVRNRKCHCENVCLFDRETEVEFMAAGGHGGIPAFMSADYGQNKKVVRKGALPLATLLDRYQAPAVIDYLSLDTEGTEYVILKDFPFDRYRFQAMTIEHNHNNRLRDNLTELLTRNGYLRVRSVLVDDWWLHRGTYEAISQDRREYWRLQEKFPPRETLLRAEETSLRYNELLEKTRSIPALGRLILRGIGKKLRGAAP